jgi:hypothetical protein
MADSSESRRVSHTLFAHLFLCSPAKAKAHRATKFCLFRVSFKMAQGLRQGTQKHEAKMLDSSGR